MGLFDFLGGAMQNQVNTNWATPTIQMGQVNQYAQQGQQDAANQGNTLAQMNAMAAGYGPSAAQAMLGNQTAQNASQAGSMASSGAGGSALARRQAMMQGQQGAQALAGQAGVARANEQIGAMGAASGLESGMRGQDIQTAGMYGNLATNQAQLQGSTNQLNAAAQAQNQQSNQAASQMFGNMAAGAIGALAGADVKTGSEIHLQEPHGPSHFILREEPDFLMIYNVRTGRMSKVATQPLSPEEQKQAMKPHGAGPLPNGAGGGKQLVSGDETFAGPEAGDVVSPRGTPPPTSAEGPPRPVAAADMTSHAGLFYNPPQGPMPDIQPEYHRGIKEVTNPVNIRGTKEMPPYIEARSNQPSYVLSPFGYVPGDEGYTTGEREVTKADEPYMRGIREASNPVNMAQEDMHPYIPAHNGQPAYVLTPAGYVPGEEPEVSVPVVQRPVSAPLVAHDAAIYNPSEITVGGAATSDDNPYTHLAGSVDDFVKGEADPNFDPGRVHGDIGYEDVSYGGSPTYKGDQQASPEDARVGVAQGMAADSAAHAGRPTPSSSTRRDQSPAAPNTQPQQPQGRDFGHTLARVLSGALTGFANPHRAVFDLSQGYSQPQPQQQSKPIAANDLGTLFAGLGGQKPPAANKDPTGAMAYANMYPTQGHANPSASQMQQPSGSGPASGVGAAGAMMGGDVELGSGNTSAPADPNAKQPDPKQKQEPKKRPQDEEEDQPYKGPLTGALARQQSPALIPALRSSDETFRNDDPFASLDAARARTLKDAGRVGLAVTRASLSPQDIFDSSAPGAPTHVDREATIRLPTLHQHFGERKSGRMAARRRKR